MRVLVIGAHHGLGAALVQAARVADHAVTAFDGDALDREDLVESLQGQQAVISALGPREGSPPDLCARGTRAIIEAMQATGARRLIVVSGAMVGDDVWLGPVYRLIRALVPRGLLADRRQAEAEVRASGLDWTLARPVRLTDEPARGTWRTDPDASVGAFARLGRIDTASAIVAALTDPATHSRALLLQR